MARKNTDANSRMLVDIYDAAHGSGGETTAQPVNIVEAATDVSGGNISALAGTWVWSHTGGSTIGTSGVYLGTNGSRFTYVFSANVHIELTGIMNVMTGGCRMQIFNTKKGRASLSGDTLTIDWAGGSFSRDDSCSPAKTIKRRLPPKGKLTRSDSKMTLANGSCA